ncbi:stromelysin-3 isoform X2 [Hypanus sabinus]|uniref:stromelysin-3 isoform X2 n=1 Tax=Hypanus sabinus TaxID=79690 RepID=UPI0028C3CD52|nr:stromelysin-3 isoform X2 [Hypanus sabinus]
MWVIGVAAALLVCSGALPVPGAPQRQKRDWLQKLNSPRDERNLTSDLFLSNAPVFRHPLRCGVPDPPPVKPGRRWRGDAARKRRFVVSGGRWQKTDLTYKIVRFPWQLSQVKVRHTIAEAVRVWSDVTPLTFTEVQDASADIIIDFTRYWHGDNLPFDGPGGVLAHAFYPQTPQQGDIHFDYEELWTTDNERGIDLLHVAAHEFGHVLGLQHSRVPKSLMAPFYTFRYPLRLAEDDRQGIQYLYGQSRHQGVSFSNQDTEVNELPSHGSPRKEPDACETDFDAVSMIRGELFFFKSKYVWRLRNRQLQPGYPALASQHWWDFPDHIDAGFEDTGGNFWIFQGSSYWIYDGEQRVLGPKLISDLGLPVAEVHAALMWGLEQNKIYLFKGNDYWQFIVNKNTVESVYPRSSSEWQGLPPSVDGAFQDEYGYAYFLRGRDYWKFDPVQVKIQERHPRRIGQDFFGCSSSPT